MTRWDYFPLQRGPLTPATGVVGGWRITSYFGGRVDPLTGRLGRHGGEDLAYVGCTGARVYAPSAGTLAQGWDSTGGGNWSGITLNDGSYFGIGHASRFAPGASYRRVKAGELIAFVGNTGASTGPHAHIAYRPAGRYVYADPHDLLVDSATRMVGEPPPISSVVPPVVEEDGMPKQVRFPDGVIYVLVPTANAPSGWGWLWVDGPQTLVDGVALGAISDKVINLAVSGSESYDAAWNRYPVLNGPKVGDH